MKTQKCYNKYIIFKFTKIFSTLELNNILKDNIEEKSNEQSKIYDEVKLEVSEHLNTNTDTETESETSECTFTNNNQEDPNYVINPYWIQDKHLKNGKIDFLSYAEEEFWRQLIKKYLHPIEIDMERQVSVISTRK